MVRLVEYPEETNAAPEATFLLPASPISDVGEMAEASDVTSGPGEHSEAVGSSGLSAAEAREHFGPNAIIEILPRTWPMLLHRFWGVIPWMLEAAIAIDLPGVRPRIEADWIQYRSEHTRR